MQDLRLSQQSLHTVLSSGIHRCVAHGTSTNISQKHAASIFRVEKNSFTCCLLHGGFLLGLLFNPEGGGNIFVQYVGWLSMDLVYSSILKVGATYLSNMSADFLWTWFTLQSWRWGQHICPICRLTFYGLHGVMDGPKDRTLDIFHVFWYHGTAKKNTRIWVFRNQNTYWLSMHIL
jgi:hypothetical protein